MGVGQYIDIDDRCGEEWEKLIMDEIEFLLNDLIPRFQDYQDTQTTGDTSKISADDLRDLLLGPEPEKNRTLEIRCGQWGRNEDEKQGRELCGMGRRPGTWFNTVPRVEINMDLVFVCDDDLPNNREYSPECGRLGCLLLHEMGHTLMAATDFHKDNLCDWINKQPECKKNGVSYPCPGSPGT